MKIIRTRYDNEFKAKVVVLLKLASKQISQEYNLPVGLINIWIRKYEQNIAIFSNKRKLSIQE